MSSNSILNEHLMVRERLQEAYRKIIFISDHDFAQDPVYKKANQVLYARIKKLEESPEVDRVRNVRDVIPNSNLARYGHYPYDEARERAYTPSWWEPLAGAAASICFPGRPEPTSESWMAPEVEQVFRHTIYAGSLNFNIYEAEFEHLDKAAVFDDLPLPSLICGAGEFRKFYTCSPVIEQLFERTTLKQLRNARNPDAHNYLPFYFNVQEYEDVLLRKKILADLVKELWNRPKLENYDKALKVYKTSLENVFVEEDNFKYVNCLKSNDTEKNLQNLVDSIVTLNEKVPKMEEVKAVPAAQQQDEAGSAPLPETPARRLYSDVVQGNKSPTKPAEVPSAKPATAEDEPKITTASVPAAIAPEENLNHDESDLRVVIRCDLEVSESPKPSHSDVANASLAPPPPHHQQQLPSTSLFLNDNENGLRTSNGCNPFQVASNTVYNTNYRLNYANATYPYVNAAQVAATRPAACPQWFIPSYRPQNICGYGNFLGQLLLPQMPTKHKWTNFPRPTTPQSPVFPNQNWNLQPAAQPPPPPVPVATCSTYEPPKAKTKKTAQPPAKFSKQKTAESKCSTSSSNKTTTFSKKSAPSGSPYKKLMTRQPEVEPTATVQFDSEIPVACSASDDLEKIALREYQSSSSSNDLFFTEIERQAAEQYDGNPENSCCPPNKSCLCLGGRVSPLLQQHLHHHHHHHHHLHVHPPRFPQMYLLYNTSYICLF